MLKNKELQQVSDLAFAAHVLQTKLNRIENPNTPIAAKLRCAISRLKDLDTKEKTRCKSWWYIQYYGEDGEQIRPNEVSDYELERIGTNVMHGFSSGELVP